MCQSLFPVRVRAGSTVSFAAVDSDQDAVDRLDGFGLNDRAGTFPVFTVSK